MSKTITVELADDVFETLSQMSAESGTPLHVLALQWITKYGPRPAPPPRSPEELRTARADLLRFAGCHHGTDPNGSDNERIDADLAKEYGDTHEPSR
jgi:hypothetical protein